MNAESASAAKPGHAASVDTDPRHHLNSQDEDGNTALHIAAASASTQVVTIIKTLLRTGADPVVVNDAGQTPLMYALAKSTSSSLPMIVDLLTEAMAGAAARPPVPPPSKKRARGEDYALTNAVVVQSTAPPTRASWAFLEVCPESGEDCGAYLHIHKALATAKDVVDAIASTPAFRALKITTLQLVFDGDSGPSAPAMSPTALVFDSACELVAARTGKVFTDVNWNNSRGKSVDAYVYAVAM
jgi:ankyrin repeat protein